MQPTANSHLACHDCDALFSVPPVEEGERVFCMRCGAVLYNRRRNSVARATAFAAASAIFFAVANMFPFLTLKAEYRESAMVLAQSVVGLEDYGSPFLATAVGVFTLAAPSLIIAGLLYLLIPLLAERRLPGALLLCRAVHEARRWNMVEVYLLGVLVSLLKLGKLATLTLGTSFWAYVGLIITLTAAVSAIDYRELWARLEAAKPT